MQSERDAGERPEAAAEEPAATAARQPNDRGQATEAPPAQAQAEDELARARAQAADYEDRWKRAVADYINYRRRTEQEVADTLREANAVLIVQLLPVLDDLELALASVPPEQANSPWVEGVRLVERKFRQILERYGVRAIDVIGRPFDPTLHEAVAGRGGVVVREYRRGYQLNGRVLRPAQVEVGEAPADALPPAPPSPPVSAPPATGDQRLTTSTEGQHGPSNRH